MKVPLRVLCPTRWTVWAKSLRSVLDNYSILQQLWDCVLDGAIDPDIRAKVIGVKALMESFDYFFGISIGELVLGHCDNLSATLQSSTISAAEGQHVATMMVSTLTKIRTDKSFILFWDSAQKKATEFDVSDPVLPRRRKMPQRYETGSATAHFPTTAEDYYRQIYFEVLDNVISTIKASFDQPSYAVYQQSQDHLLKSACGVDCSSEFASVTDFYGDDFSDKQRLLHQFQLHVLLTQFNNSQSETDLKDVVAF